MCGFYSTWLCLSAKFFCILGRFLNKNLSLHLIRPDFKDTLREEEREVNHHGRVRQFDADGNEITNENKS